MSETKLPYSSSNNFFSEPDTLHYTSIATSPTQVKKKKEEFLPGFLSALDEAPDFHNPFSDLNLFLSQEIKEHMRHSGSKWSGKIQEELVNRINCKFQKRFPHLRLGISALKKTWERVAYYLEQIQTQKEAINQDGKLNLSFFIKENLKQLPSIKGSFHPSLYTHQIAVKMSECIATIDGLCPKFDHLTKLIWSVQRHLLSQLDSKDFKSPYDECDKIDRLIIRIILGLTAKTPHLSQLDLEYQVKETLQSLRGLPSFSSQETMRANVAALLSDKLYASFQSRFLTEEKKAILSFIRRHLSLCKYSSPKIMHGDLVRRVQAIYLLACQLPKNLPDEAIEAAVYAVRSQSKQAKPSLPQSLLAFVSAEFVLEESSIQATIRAYHEARKLPLLLDKEKDLLEIVIWKILTEDENLLEKLPYIIGQRIEEEIANVFIDQPHQNFSSTVQEVVAFFQEIKELTSANQNIEHKIHRWSVQNDMIYRWIHLDKSKPLLQLIKDRMGKSYDELLCDVTTTYLTKHPELLPYAPQLKHRILSLYKYLWYASSASSKESSFDRFLKWHASLFLSQSPQLDEPRLLRLLEELCKRALPLIPFDPAHCRALLADLYPIQKEIV